MDSFSLWLEGTELSTTMRNTAWLWPACESLHFIGLTLLIGGAGYFDLRLLGFMRGVSVKAAKAFMGWAIVGFAVNLVTGVLFLIMSPHLYVASAAWWSKMLFVVVAGFNALLFETALGARVMPLGPNEDTPISSKIVGGVSLFSWFAVLFLGRMLPYIGTGN